MCTWDAGENKVDASSGPYVCVWESVFARSVAALLLRGAVCQPRAVQHSHQSTLLPLFGLTNGCLTYQLLQAVVGLRSSAELLLAQHTCAVLTLPGSSTKGRWRMLYGSSKWTYVAPGTRLHASAQAFIPSALLSTHTSHWYYSNPKLIH